MSPGLSILSPRVLDVLSVSAVWRCALNGYLSESGLQLPIMSWPQVRNSSWSSQSIGGCSPCSFGWKIEKDDMFRKLSSELGWIKNGKEVSRAGPKTRQPKYLSLYSKEGLECTSEIVLSVWSGPRLSLAEWDFSFDLVCSWIRHHVQRVCGVENYRLFSVSFTRRWSRKARYFVIKVSFQFQFHGAEKFWKDV